MAKRAKKTTATAVISGPMTHGLDTGIEWAQTCDIKGSDRLIHLEALELAKKLSGITPRNRLRIIRLAKAILKTMEG